MPAPIDHDTIRENYDRRKTTELLVRLTEESDRLERQELVKTLAGLDDPRSVAPLMGILVDPAQNPEAREACGTILLDMQNSVDPSDETLRQWWASGDEVLRVQALRRMSAEQQELLDSVLDDPEHPLYREAVEGLMFVFPAATKTGRLVAALGHPSSEVRYAAAGSLVWSEPLGGYPALLRACEDSEAAVLVRVLSTLAYYPTLGTIHAAVSLLEHPSPDVVDAAQDCLTEVADAVVVALSEAAVEEPLRAWLGPLWSKLGIDDEDIEEVRGVVGPRKSATKAKVTFPWMTSTSAFEAHFGDLDVSPRKHERELRQADWPSVESALREAFAEALTASLDALVRSAAVPALVAWKDRGRLLRLLVDPCFSVRKATMYGMRSFGVDEELAAIAWAQLPKVASTHLWETLGTAIALSEPGTWFAAVSSIVADEAVEEACREAAVRALCRAGAREAIAENLSLLQCEPVLTWSLHAALVESALELKIELPDLSHLRSVDHLVAQEILALADAARAH